MMITELEFENALGIIACYQLQSEKNLNAIKNSRKINIQNDIGAFTFKILQDYFLIEYKIVLKKEDLSTMDSGLLASINYEKLVLYRGFGKLRLFNFKKLMISHSILGQEEL